MSSLTRISLPLISLVFSHRENKGRVTEKVLGSPSLFVQRSCEEDSRDPSAGRLSYHQGQEDSSWQGQFETHLGRAVQLAASKSKTKNRRDLSTLHPVSQAEWIVGAGPFRRGLNSGSTSMRRSHRGRPSEPTRVPSKVLT